MTKRLILASASPRRQELLRLVQIPFQVQPSDIDESKITTSDPVEKVTQLATLKNQAISLEQDEVILTADTVVAFNNQIYDKPKNKQEAFQMIKSLSGNIHDVYTGVMIRSHQHDIRFIEQTKVEFWPLTDEIIEKYVKTDDPYDKAGAYGIQSLGAQFVKQIQGDYYNVVGLPISRVVRELAAFHIYPAI